MVNACPIFENALVTLSESFVRSMPTSLNVTEFLEESCKDLKCISSNRDGKCVHYSLEGFWDRILQAQDVLIHHLAQWNSSKISVGDEVKSERIANHANADNSDILSIKIKDSGIELGDKCSNEIIEVHNSGCNEFQSNDPVYCLETKRLMSLDTSTGESANESQTVTTGGQNTEELKLSPISGDTLLKSNRIFCETDLDHLPAENLVYMDIKLEHNYNNLNTVNPLETASGRNEPAVENEIYMDIKLSKPSENIFTNPDLPVTLVVAKEDEQGIEVHQLKVNENSVVSPSQVWNESAVSRDNQEQLKLRKKKYEDDAPFKYFCGQCSFKTKRHSHMRNHARYHEKVCTIYSCDQCDFSTIRASHLQRHKVVHRTETFSCSDCQYITHSETSLMKHQRYKHILKKSEEKANDTFQCLQCNYMTTSEKIFQRHVSVHAKKGKMKQPCFKCASCTYQTPSRSNYYRHIAAVHDEERPYMCTTCGLCFKRSDTLVQHQATHSDKEGGGRGYTCPHCKKSYRSQSALKEHSLTHGNERRYLCEICAASFKTRAIQRKHYNQKHALAKIHTCPSCLKSFSSKYLLKRHSSVHSSMHVVAEPSTPDRGENTRPASNENSQDWDVATIQPMEDDVQVIVVEESEESELSIQEGPLLQVAYLSYS